MYLVMARTGPNGLVALLESAGCVVASGEVELGPDAIPGSPTGSRIGESETRSDDAGVPVILPFEDPGDLGALVREGRVSPETRYLLVWSNPLPVVAGALGAGGDPEVIIRGWMSAAGSLLEIFRHRRAHSLMVESGTAIDRPHAFLRACRERFGFDLGTGDPGDSAADDPGAGSTRSSAGPVERLIAGELVRRTPGMSALVEEIEASTFPLGESTSGESPTADPLAACAELRALRGAANEGETELEQENDLLLEELHRVQVELEEYFLRWKESSAALGQSETRLASVRRTEETGIRAERRLEEAEKENRALAEDVRRLREEIDRSRGQWEETGTSVQAMEEAVEMLTARHRDLLALVEADARPAPDREGALAGWFRRIRRNPAGGTRG
jgi:hypothetical protein